MERSTTVIVKGIVFCLTAAALASPASAQVSHNAPTKYGATLYSWSDGYQSLPPQNIYPPTIPWNVNSPAWWNSVVSDAHAAGLGYLTVAGWGWGSNSDPAFVVPPLLSALNTVGTGMKVALFDDTTSEVLRKNLARGHGWNTSVKFNLEDGSPEGGWHYFWDFNWRRYFQATANSGRRLEINGRPVVFMWHGGAEMFTNHHAFSNLIAAIRAACQNEFGFNPYIIIEESWLDLDPDTLADATYDWFDPQKGTISYHVNPYNNQSVSVGIAVPGYDGHLFNDGSYRPGPWSRANGQTYVNALNVAAPANLVLIESINNVEENAHIMRSTAWGTQYIDITRGYALPTGGGGNPSGDSELTQNELLNPGDLIRSPDNRFTFTYQLDGNIVLYQQGVGPIWASSTMGFGSGGQLVMQTDGNLVLYSAGVPWWHTHTYGFPGARLKVQNDGNVVIYAANGQWIWQTGTCCR
jgi:hypothetical protein